MNDEKTKNAQNNINNVEKIERDRGGAQEDITVFTE